MVKRKLRERIRARSDTSMINEILCRALVHNICVLIQERYELKLEVNFNEAKGFYELTVKDKLFRSLPDYF
ncbi:MAG: hypothetical protein WC501_02290 [Candidatus Micrarchaeia archaeon]|jgi:hypothetical protein